MKQITPNMAVEDVARSVRFYTEILGFELKMCVDEHKRPADTLQVDVTYVWANVMHGTVGVMFQQKENFGEDIGVDVENIGASVSFYIEVEDAEAFYETLKGKVSIQKEIGTTWYGAKEFYIKDPDGYILGFSSIKV